MSYKPIGKLHYEVGINYDECENIFHGHEGTKTLEAFDKLEEAINFFGMEKEKDALRNKGFKNEGRSLIHREIFIDVWEDGDEIIGEFQFN